MQKAIKRIFDVVFSLLAIVALAPIWLIVAIWVGVSSPGGIFFRQKRTGYKGKDFDMLKFRSMYINNQADTKQADDADPRITPIGRIIRKTSLDELPQLINVLKGDMSIIGPRPHMVAHTEYYTPLVKRYDDRHRMRPGLTGYAQAQGLRGATPRVEDMQRRIDADNYYIDHYSLLLDLKVFTMTIWKMLTLQL